MAAPLYVSRPNIRRVIVADALKTIILCAIFYAAILVNVRLLLSYRVLSAPPPLSLHLALGGVLFLLFFLELLTVYRKYGVVVYDIYPDRIEAYGKQLETIPLARIADVKLKQNVFDFLFKTGTLVFHSDQPALRMEHIPYPAEVFPYIQRLVAQSRSVDGGGYGVQQVYPYQQQESSY